MATYIAFLRAINLGAKRKFPAGEVRAVLEAAGFAGVETHLNTGNVRLDSTMRSRARLEAALERAFLEDRGFDVPTVVLTLAELRAVAQEGESLGHAGRHYVSLLKHEPEAGAVAALEARSTGQEEVRVRGRAVHLLLGENYHEARLTNVVVEKHLGVATNRNLTVVRALSQKWG